MHRGRFDGLLHLAYCEHVRREAAFAAIYDRQSKSGKSCRACQVRPYRADSWSTWNSCLFAVDQAEDTYRARWHKYCFKRLQVLKKLPKLPIFHSKGE